MQPRKNLIQHAENLILPGCDIVHLRLVDAAVFVHPAGNLIDVIAQAPQQPDSLMQLRQIQLQHVAVQRHGPDIWMDMILVAAMLAFLQNKMADVISQSTLLCRMGSMIEWFIRSGDSAASESAAGSTGVPAVDL